MTTKGKPTHTLDWKHPIGFHQSLTGVCVGTASIEETILYHLPKGYQDAVQFLQSPVLAFLMFRLKFLLGSSVSKLAIFCIPFCEKFCGQFIGSFDFCVFLMFTMIMDLVALTDVQIHVSVVQVHHFITCLFCSFTSRMKCP